MPMRPKKSLAALASAVPRLEHEPLSIRSENRISSPPPAPPVADPNPAPRRASTPQRPASLVVRNTRKPRIIPFYTSVRRSNHYLLARSFVKNDQPPRSPLPLERKPRENQKTTPLRLYRDAPSPNPIIADFIWQFSTQYLDPETRDALFALRSHDPETFEELVAGFD